MPTSQHRHRQSPEERKAKAAESRMRKRRAETKLGLPLCRSLIEASWIVERWANGDPAYRGQPQPFTLNQVRDFMPAGQYNLASLKHLGKFYLRDLVDDGFISEDRMRLTKRGKPTYTWPGPAVDPLACWKPLRGPQWRQIDSTVEWFWVDLDRRAHRSIDRWHEPYSAPRWQPFLTFPELLGDMVSYPAVDALVTNPSAPLVAMTADSNQRYYARRPTVAGQSDPDGPLFRAHHAKLARSPWAERVAADLDRLPLALNPEFPAYYTVTLGFITITHLPTGRSVEVAEDPSWRPSNTFELFLLWCSIVALQGASAQDWLVTAIHTTPRHEWSSDDLLAAR